jgi:MFS family permease
MPTVQRAPLTRDAKLLLVGVGSDALGTGLILPFLVIYLHEVRGIPVDVVGVLAALPAVVALGLLGPLGVVIDRFGPRRVQMLALAMQAAGAVILAFADSVGEAALAMLLTGVGHATYWPARQALIASVLPSETRARYFGISFTLLNAGIGLGGVVGALYLDVEKPERFTHLYLGDALSFVLPLVLLAGVLRHVGGPADVPSDGQPAPSGSYRDVLRDTVFRRVLVLVGLTSFVGYSQIEAGWTAYARLVGEVSTRTIGIAFAVNTSLIVALQLIVLNRIEGRRRTRVLMVLAAVWAVSWAVLGSAGLVAGTFLAAFLVIASMAVFAFGETLLSPIGPAITNDLAPDHLRGRYNAVASLAFQVAAVSGPVTAGLLVGNGLGGVYIGLLVAACGVFALVARSLEQLLPRRANGLSDEPLDLPRPGLETVPGQL